MGARLAVTGKDAEHPFGQPGLEECVSERLHRQRRLRRRLQDHRASCRQGRRDLEGRGAQRAVPGGDRPYHPDWLLGDQARVGAVRTPLVVGEPACQVGVVAGVPDRVRHVCHLAEPQGASELGGDAHRQLGRTLLQEVRGLVHHLRALLRRGPGPHAGVEGGPSGGDSRVDVIGRGEGRGTDPLSVRRVAHLGDRSSAWILPPASHEELRPLGHGIGQ